MSNKKVIDNLMQVRKETQAMLENLKAVRGQRHAKLVLSLLHATAATEVMATVASHTELDFDTKSSIAEAFCMCIHHLVESMAKAGGITDAEIADAMQDAGAISDSSTNLARQAFEAGRNGDGFGGKTPH